MGRKANWSTILWAGIAGKIHLETTNFSATWERRGVTEIGLYSESVLGSNADNVNSITSGYTLNTASCSSLLHILILVLSVAPVQHSSICHSRRMVRRLRVEKLPENVSVSPSRGSCRRNAHSRLRQDPSGVAARRGSGSLRPYVAPTSTEGARNRRVMELFQLPGSSGRGGPAGSRPRAAVGPCLPVSPPSTGNASSLEGLSPSATSCSSMISGQRLFKLLLTPRLQRPRRRIVGAVVPFQCVPVPFHAHTHTATKQNSNAILRNSPATLTALKGCPPMRYALM